MLAENRQKRQSDRANKALNKMIFGKLSKRSRVAKKQRTTALGPKNKVSSYSGSEPDPEDKVYESTMNIKDKITETLLNSFNLMLNELNRAERAVASGEVSQKTKNRYMRKRRKGDFQETPDAWTDQVNRIHGTNTPPQGSERYASANRAKNKARGKKKKVPVIVPTQSTKKGPGKQTGPIEGRGLKGK